MIRVPPLVTLVVAGAVAGGLAGCAPGGTDAARPYAVGAEAPVTYGTIVGVRRVTPRVGGGPASPAGDWRSSLLAGLGGTGAAGRMAEVWSEVRAVEFLVREDDGREIATVRTNEDGLAMGERVAIIRTGGTRLARATGGVPPARPAAARLSTAPFAAPSAAPFAAPSGAPSGAREATRSASRSATTIAGRPGGPPAASPDAARPAA